MDKKVVDELEHIRTKDGGVLYPESVISYAEDSSTALHDKFEWDDVKAGHSYRLWQARQLIKAVVWVEPSKDIPTSLYVSLSNDRKDNGGYRVAAEVLSDTMMRELLLSDAFKDFEYWKHKYDMLHELSDVFMAMERVEGKHKKKGK